MAQVLLKNGTVVGEHGVVDEALDVLVEEGVIAAIGKGLDLEGEGRIFDLTGKLVMPGMFDAHVHFRQPGQEHKETILSGTEAAIRGGVTGVVMMPNTSPAIDSGAMVKLVSEIAQREARIPVHTSGCITKKREGMELAGIAGMREAGVLMLTDDGDAVANPLLLRRAMEYATELGMFFASHCEVEELAGPRALNEGVMSYRLGILGTPAIAEEICLARDISLAHAVGAQIHIQHVSTKLGMETIRWWKEKGTRVTAEVSPHHLLFIDEDIGDFDTHFKMNPPLRTLEDRSALLEGLKDGTLDLIATDHAPHSSFEKSQDFVNAPNGITGLETALISLYDRFVSQGLLTWEEVVRRYSVEPRKLMQLEPAVVQVGAKAELIGFDPNGSTSFTEESMRSKSQNTPFFGQTLKGSIDLVMVGDEVFES